MERTWLDTTPAEKIPDQEKVKEAFIKSLSGIHKLTEADATAIYEKEKMYYKKALTESEKLSSCTKISLYSVFIEIAIQNLSIQPGSKSQAYLEARGVKSGGTRENPTYTNVAYFRITAYGELDLRIRSGQIIRMMNPICLYEGDKFQPRTNERGQLVVDYVPMIPRKSNKIYGCWVCVVLPNNQLDFKWLLEEDIARLKKYATIKTQNGGSYSNPLYTSENGNIDSGFLETKTIKQAMRSYTKLRVGENVMLEDEEPFNPDEKEPFAPTDTDTAQTVTIENEEERDDVSF